MSRPANPGRVVELVADFYYVTVDEIVSGSHDQVVVRARSMALVMLRKLCGFSWKRAWRAVGMADNQGLVLDRINRLTAEFVDDVEAFVLGGLHEA